ncbi:hypothetical protein [Streptomyces sp. AVP053U2]|nr:hypothetical protein [Streptomyces sp. AVP053U2]
MSSPAHRVIRSAVGADGPSEAWGRPRVPPARRTARARLSAQPPA